MPADDASEARVPPARVTIAHVASRAGVSPTTVSHVLSGKRVVGAATRDTVMDAIRELGYRPSHVARNLRTRQSHMVALVVPDIANPYYAVLTRGLADALDAAGYGTYLCNTDGRHERERESFQDVMDRGVDGIVFASGEALADITFGPGDLATPITCIGGRLEHPLCDAVIPDVDAATIVTPALTTVRNPAYEVGSTAGDLLLSRMTGRYTGAGRTVGLPRPLVPRGTA